MLYIALCNAISDQKAQNGRRESMEIMSDKYANYKYNLKYIIYIHYKKIHYVHGANELEIRLL